jgi:uncharacterized protein YbjT (DUF2867 family)
MDVLVTGGTGYIGRRLIPLLAEDGHRVRTLVRRGSEGKAPPGCEAVPGNALDPANGAAALAAGGTLVHLVGVAHPSPAKAAEFERVDGASVEAALEGIRRAAGSGAALRHFVYLSVAHPAPAMRAYWSVRQRCEARIAASGVAATFLRPWYVLGPGHRWPVALAPLYALARWIPAWRETAARLALVRLADMLGALRWAVENPPAAGVRVVEAGEITAIGRARALR